eukprot:GDKI01038675.1.p1 GENE.GDKI01038675.1~~GDKI01038675.1.p1  ORF type:complete len:144 (-),score=33.56 GDKI01038675.1:223-606(-)
MQSASLRMFTALRAASVSSAMWRHSGFAVRIPMTFRAFASMSQSDVESKMVDILKIYAKEGQTLTPSLGLEGNIETRENRKWDALDTVEYLLDIEQEFKVTFPDEFADGVKNVQQAAEYIVKHAPQS